MKHSIKTPNTNLVINQVHNPHKKLISYSPDDVNLILDCSSLMLFVIKTCNILLHRHNNAPPIVCMPVSLFAFLRVLARLVKAKTTGSYPKMSPDPIVIAVSRAQANKSLSYAT